MNSTQSNAKHAPDEGRVVMHSDTYTAMVVAHDHLKAINAELLAALERLAVIDEHKLASLEKRPYAIGLVTVRERVEQTRTAIARAKGAA